jgi:hypothetical protein
MGNVSRARFGAVVFVALVFGATACSGEPAVAPEVVPEVVTGDRIGASIGGVPWTAVSSTITAGAATPGRPGSLTFEGRSTANPARSVAFSIARIPGPGTYPIGVNLSSATGATATVTEGTRSWATPLTGAAGSLTITSITAARVAGSFAFSADPASGTTAAPVEVTNGTFDVPLSTGFVAATPREMGGTLSMSIGGVSGVWNAATAAATISGSSLLVFTASNLAYTIIIENFPITLGTGPLGNSSPVRRITVRRNDQPTSVWGGTAVDQGTLSIAQQIGAGRLVGAFSGTLAPSLPGSTLAPLVITNGLFNVPSP